MEDTKNKEITDNVENVLVVKSSHIKKLIMPIIILIAIIWIGTLYLIDKKRVDRISASTEKIDKKLDVVFGVLKVLVYNDSVSNIQLRHFPTTAPMDLINMTKVSSEFQNRIDPVTKKKQFHWGIDYEASKDTKVYASAEGLVEEADWNDGYGRYIRINHTNGYETVYAHLDSIKVHKGDIVKKGELIGLVGSTGMTTGTHLHYEIYYLNQHINPNVFTATY